MTDQFFFCGIGGSGMLPLAAILRAGGARVAGSDRSLDAGRLGSKFEYLRSLGIGLAPQDGSGLGEGMTLVTSAAVEATIPDVVRATELGLGRLTRPQLLAKLLNAAQTSIAVLRAVLTEAPRFISADDSQPPPMLPASATR